MKIWGWNCNIAIWPLDISSPNFFFGLRFAWKLDRMHVYTLLKGMPGLRPCRCTNKKLLRIYFFYATPRARRSVIFFCFFLNCNNFLFRHRHGLRLCTRLNRVYTYILSKFQSNQEKNKKVWGWNCFRFWHFFAVWHFVPKLFFLVFDLAETWTECTYILY